MLYIFLSLLDSSLTQVLSFRIRVRLGEYNTRTNPDCVVDNGYQECADSHQDVGVETAIAHPGYNDGSKSRYHDIGLVRLSRPVEFTG